MIRWMIVAAALACLVVAAGCVNVKVPEGPYIKVEDGSRAPSKSNVEFTKGFLQSARQEGVISEAQYKEMLKRLNASAPSQLPEDK